MQNRKTDESVKAGLKIEGDTRPLDKQHTPDAGEEELDEEMDVDDTVHQQGFEPTASHDEEDADDLVHREPPTKTIRDDSEFDADDLVHRK